MTRSSSSLIETETVASAGGWRRFAASRLWWAVPGCVAPALALMSPHAWQIAFGTLTAGFGLIALHRAVARVAELPLALRIREAAQLQPHRPATRFDLEDLMARCERFVLVLDAKGRIEYCNGPLRAVVSGSGDPVGTDWFTSERLGADAISQRRAYLRALTQGVPPAPSTSNLRAASGELLVVRWVHSVSRDERGRVDGCASIGEDVTEQRAAQAALAASEARLRSMVCDAPVGLGIVGADGRWVEVNDKLAELLGHENRQLLHGQSLLDAAHPSERATLKRRLSSFIAGRGMTEPATLRFERRDGQPIRLIQTFAALHAGGALQLLVALAAPAQEDGGPVSAAVDASRVDYQCLTEALPFGIYRIDGEHRVTYMNSKMRALLGLADDPVGKVLYELPGFTAGERTRSANERAFLGERIVETLEIRRAGSGNNVFLQVIRIPVTSGSGGVRGVQVVAEDVTRERQQNAEQRLMSQVFASSGQGIMVTDPIGRIVTVNAAFSRITGYSEADALGQTPRLLSSGRHDAPFFQSLWAQLAAHGRWEGEIWNRRKNGELYPQSMSIDVLKNEGGAISHLVAMFTDASERRASEARIDLLAHYDTVTGLPNRTLMRARLDSLVEPAQGDMPEAAVLLLDLDRFKNINDSLGHSLGDEVLLEVGRRLRGAVRARDTVSRQGGDEFVLLLPEAGADEAQRVAQTVLATLTQPFIVGGSELVISGSVGIALFPSNGADADTLLRNADAAMYAAKEAGRGAFRFFDHDMNMRAAQRLVIERDLRLALGRGELFLEYQPQRDLRTDEMVGIEALVRWRHPVEGVLPPGLFIGIAEDSDLIVSLGAFVLQAACRQRALWYRRGFQAGPVAVNVSSRQFRRPDFVDLVKQCVEDAGLPAHLLELEVTESVVMHGTEDVLAKMRTLDELGVRLSIDDFGTGYSSLSYLKRFPIHQLKIDRSFVSGLPNDRGSAAIAQAIISISHTLGLSVIAEGVETVEQAAFLRGLGCGAAQGFLYARPAGPAACERQMREWALNSGAILDS